MNTINKAVIKINQELGRCIVLISVYWFGTGSEEHILYLRRDGVKLRKYTVCGFYECRTEYKQL